MLRFLGFPLLHAVLFAVFFPLFLHFISLLFFATAVKNSIIITIKKPGNRLKTKKKFS